MSSFGELLRQFTEDYFSHPVKGINITAYCTMADKVEKLHDCCKDHKIAFSKRDIIDFLNNLFREDPNAISLKPQYNDGFVDYQESGAPYKYGLVDYNNLDYNDKPHDFEEKEVSLEVDDNFTNEYDEKRPPVKIKYKRPIKKIRRMQERYKARPKCEKEQGGCNKLAYFGLPFCPWCMKQIPPYYPKVNHRKFMFKGSSGIMDSPLIDFSLIQNKGCNGDENTTVHVIAGVPTRFDLDDYIVDDGDIKVTYRDVERERKNVDRYIP